MQDGHGSATAVRPRQEAGPAADSVMLEPVDEVMVTTLVETSSTACSPGTSG